MENFSYKIEHDYGLAPNPFGGYCTLAVCKSSIRKNTNLEIGSWVFGTGSKKLTREGQLIFAMQVEEKLTFNQYWQDPRFQYKKPQINGSLVQMYGDNIYHQDKRGNWIQENSAHSLNHGQVNKDHLKRDIGGKYVLISTNFYYFGDNAIKIPKKYTNEICCQGRDMKSPSISKEVVSDFILWLNSNYKKSILHGNPINWARHLKK